MKKKILIGSIIATVVIILAGFTSVVGFQSKDSSKVRFSPLFGIRAKRAVGEESQDAITCNYLGKNRAIFIPLPKLDDELSLLKKVIDKISKMDDETFEKFIAAFNIHIHQSNSIKKENIDKAVSLLYQLRKQSEVTIDNIISTMERSNVNRAYTVNGSWRPGCILGPYLAWLVIITFFATAFIYIYFRGLCTMIFQCGDLSTFRFC